MHHNTEKAAPCTANTESGKQEISNISVPLKEEKVKCIRLYGLFETDPEGNALLYGASVGEIVGNMLPYSGYTHVEIKVWRDEV